MAILELVLSSFWAWAGFVIIICAIGNAATDIVKAFRK